MVQVTIKDKSVSCSCGFEDISSWPIRLARLHNAKSHSGNLPIVDEVAGLEISQFSGEYLQNID